jgi:hypothetical protein
LRAALTLIALTVSGVVLLTLCAARWSAQGFNFDQQALLSAGPFAAGALLLAIFAWRERRPRVVQTELRIDERGQIAVRDARGESSARPEYIGGWLIVLVAPTHRVVVWRDALEPDQFRRLNAIARWRIERKPSAEETEDAEMVGWIGNPVQDVELKAIGRVSVEQTRGTSRHGGQP